MEHIEFTEKQISTAFNKIRSGDRSDLMKGKLFNTKELANFNDKELMEIRKFIKKSITELEILNESADDKIAKDNILKLALYDQMKYEIKNLMEPVMTK